VAHKNRSGLTVVCFVTSIFSPRKKNNWNCANGDSRGPNTKHEMNNIFVSDDFFTMIKCVCVCVCVCIGLSAEGRKKTPYKILGVGGGRGYGPVVAGEDWCCRRRHSWARREWRRFGGRRMNNGPATGRNTFATGRFVHVNVRRARPVTRGCDLERTGFLQQWKYSIFDIIPLPWLVTISKSGRGAVESLSGPPPLENKISKLILSLRVHPKSISWPRPLACNDLSGAHCFDFFFFLNALFRRSFGDSI